MHPDVENSQRVALRPARAHACVYAADSTLPHSRSTMHVHAKPFMCTMSVEIVQFFLAIDVFGRFEQSMRDRERTNTNNEKKSTSTTTTYNQNSDKQLIE